MPELMVTLNAQREVEHRKQKFMAAIQGIDLDENSSSSKEEPEVTVEMIQARAIARLTGDTGKAALTEMGITDDFGLTYDIM